MLRNSRASECNFFSALSITMRNIFNAGASKIGRFGRSVLRKGGNLAKSAYENRDLIAKGVGIGLPILAGGLSAGPAGALGAAAAQVGELADLKQQVKSRRTGLTRGGVVDRKDISAIKSGAKAVKSALGQNVSEKKVDAGKLAQLKQLAQGQSV